MTEQITLEQVLKLVGFMRNLNGDWKLIRLIQESGDQELIRLIQESGDQELIEAFNQQQEGNT